MTGASSREGGMRIVVVNHMHPAVTHVSGMRAGHFARELALRGHRVVVICQRTSETPASETQPVRARLAGHDWGQPMIVAVTPQPTALLTRVRSVQTPPLIRKGLVAWSYLRHTGVFTDFSRAAQSDLVSLAHDFQPHVVWGIFGNSDCWLLAQRLAWMSRCGWVADMKDAWDAWMPRGIRTLVARRFRDMTASTANAAFHAEACRRWFPTPTTVVYSGVDADWIPAMVTPAEHFRVMLVGGVYDDRNLTRLIGAFDDWVLTLSPADRERVTMSYAGSDNARVAAVLDGMQLSFKVVLHGYLPLPELARLCKEAAVNVYLWSPTTFHHKLVELLACRRPILAFPGERRESGDLAQQVGGSLTVCADASQLREACDGIWRGGLQPSGGADALEVLTWSAQTDRLERVLRQAAEAARR